MSQGEILEKVNEELKAQNQPIVEYKSTIAKDLKYIAQRWGVEYDKVPRGKEYLFKYKDPDFSIFKSALTPSEIDKLNHVIDLLKDFVGLPQFEWIDDIRAKIHVSAYTQGKPIVTFSHNPTYTAPLRHFTPLFDLIKSKTAIELTYQKFNSEAPSTRIFHPYHLKEFQNRWYLVGWCREHSDHLSCFGFERIISYEKSDAPFVENPGFDVEEYFGAMVGITIPDGAKPQDVEIWVEARECPYVESNPIHQSQRYVRDENGGKVYALHLFLNYELEMRLLAYGERLRVLAPDGFRQRMRERTLAMAEMYEKDDVKSYFSV